MEDGVKGDLGERIGCNFWPEATDQTVGFVFEVDRVISLGVGDVWANGAKRNRPICERPSRHAASPGAFQGSKVPGAVEDGCKINDCEAVRRRWDKCAVSSEAVGAGIEDRRGRKVPNVQKPVPVPTGLFLSKPIILENQRCIFEGTYGSEP